VLLYRGYPVEQLAEHSSLWKSPSADQRQLAAKAQLDAFGIRSPAYLVNEHCCDSSGFPSRRAIPWRWSLRWSLDGRLLLRHDRHYGPRHRRFRASHHATTARIAAAAYKHTLGQLLYPRNDWVLANMLICFFRFLRSYLIESVAAEALDLYSSACDHEQNASTSDRASGGNHRGVILGGYLGGGFLRSGVPAHGGANEARTRHAGRTGRRPNIGKFLARVKDKQTA